MIPRNRILGWLPRSSRPLVESGFYGLVAGLIAVGFEISITLLFTATIVRFSQAGPGAFAGLSFLMIIGSSLASGFLLTHFAPEAAGSGIPQTKLAFWKDFGFIPGRILWVKFVAGLLAVGGGGSLGREGPTVQLSATLASNVAGLLGIAKTGRRRATAAGSAAGLAAAFNTPLAAIAFVLEEILGDLNSALLGSVVVAAVLGAFVVHAFLGSHPAFDLPGVETATWRGNVLVPLAALLASLIGISFQYCSLELRKSCRTSPLNRIPAWTRPACGAFLTWIVGCSVFLFTGHLGVFGVGYGDLSAGLQGRLIGLIPVILLVGKFAATVFSYGSGGCGGIFAPALFLGALSGCLVQESARLCGLPLTTDDSLLLEVVAMSSCLGAVVRAPFTSILIVFEMTREFSLVPALLVGGVISQALSRFVLPYGFYEQILVDDGHHLKTVMPPRDFREWQDYPISAIANFQPVILPDLQPATLSLALEKHVFSRFFHQAAGSPPVMMLRSEISDSLATGKEVVRHDLPTCLRTDPIQQVQNKIVENPYGVIAVLDGEHGAMIGLLTLHDILRAQQNMVVQDDRS